MEGEGKLRATRREGLESLARQGDPEAIHILASQPELPRLAAHLWEYWCDLGQTRSTNGMSVCPLSRLEVQTWEKDEGIELASWERRAIFRIDALWMGSLASAGA